MIDIYLNNFKGKLRTIELNLKNGLDKVDELILDIEALQDIVEARGDQNAKDNSQSPA